MEVEGAHDLSPGLSRQRRNLMAASTVLLFLGFSQAKLESLRAFGIHIVFGRPDALVIGLIAVTGYLSYRYVLYLVQEPGPGLIDEYFRRLNVYAEPKIAALRDAWYPEAKGMELGEQLGVRSKAMFSWVVLVQSGQDGAGGILMDELTVNLRQVWPESIRAALMSGLVRSYFTDYIFPLVLASSVIAVGVYERAL